MQSGQDYNILDGDYLDVFVSFVCTFVDMEESNLVGIVGNVRIKDERSILQSCENILQSAMLLGDER